MTVQQTVFIVDDDEAAAASVAALMVSLGYQIETYLSAEAFLQAYDGKRRGCLLMDVRMPGMSGLELQDEMLKRAYDLPVIVVSGHVDSDICSRLIRKGAVACFTKPFDVENLCNAIEELLTT